MREAFEERLWGKEFDTRRRQFNSQRESIQTDADLSSDTRVGFCQPKTRVDAPGAIMSCNKFIQVDGGVARSR
jgi:hypothetical protein